jgi:flagellar basal-body rod protein FlgG
MFPVLAAIGCSESSQAEKPGNSDSAPRVVENSRRSSPEFPRDRLEARVVRALAEIDPYSPTGGGIELLVAKEPVAAPSAPANFQCRNASTSLPADLPKEARRTLASATDALETKLNVAIDNLANAQSPGFKRRRVILTPLPPRHDALAGVQDSAGNLSAVGIAVGQGCKVECVQTDFSQGALVSTARPLDLAIEGDGFFQVQLDCGELVYTRVANLNTNPIGSLVIGSATSGRILQPPITIPPDALEVTISPEGAVSVRQPGVTSLSQVGCICLGRFINNDGLRALGGGLYAETDASGPPTIGTPGQKELGRLRQGALEASNVDTERESAELQDLRSVLSLLKEVSRSDSMSPSR